MTTTTSSPSSPRKSWLPATTAPCGAIASCCPLRRPRRTRRCASAGARSISGRPSGTELGIAKLWVKDDGNNPTASLKDRASAMAVAKAQEARGEGHRLLLHRKRQPPRWPATPPQRALKTFIFVPSRAPKGKVAQLMTFGANVVSVQGNYEETFELSKKAIDRWGCITATRPSTLPLEGKKTVASEITEQLNWRCRTSSPSPSATAARSPVYGRV